MRNERGFIDPVTAAAIAFGICVVLMAVGIYIDQSMMDN